MSAMRSLVVFLVVYLGSVTLSDCFQHFSLSTKSRRAPSRLFVASPTSKLRVFNPKYLAPPPVDVKSFNQPVTFDEVDKNILKVVEGQLPDQDCNLLCWRCLGYKYDENMKNFTNDGVMNRWKKIYPQPVDLIGLYDTENFKIDRPVDIAAKELWRTIAEHYRDGLSEMPGFQQIKASNLTTNLARRIMIATWLIYYAGELHGKTPAQIEEEWAANRKAANDEKNGFRKELKQYERASKRFRIEPDTSTEPKPKNRSQRDPIGKNKRDRRDADGM